MLTGTKASVPKDITASMGASSRIASRLLAGPGAGMTDSDADVRWMSYAEAAMLLGVNPESVARRMRRDNWARRRGNDGKPRVAIPVHLLPTSPAVQVNVPDSVPGDAVGSAPS